MMKIIVSIFIILITQNTIWSENSFHTLALNGVDIQLEKYQRKDTKYHDVALYMLPDIHYSLQQNLAERMQSLFTIFILPSPTESNSMVLGEHYNEYKKYQKNEFPVYYSTQSKESKYDIHWNINELVDIIDSTKQNIFMVTSYTLKYGFFNIDNKIPKPKILIILSPSKEIIDNFPDFFKTDVKLIWIGSIYNEPVIQELKKIYGGESFILKKASSGYAIFYRNHSIAEKIYAKIIDELSLK